MDTPFMISAKTEKSYSQQHFVRNSRSSRHKARFGARIPIGPHFTRTGTFPSLR